MGQFDCGSYIRKLITNDRVARYLEQYQPELSIEFQKIAEMTSTSRPCATQDPRTPAGEVDDGIWLASFMHYDLGYFDLEQKTLQPSVRSPDHPQILKFAGRLECQL